MDVRSGGEHHGLDAPGDALVVAPGHDRERAGRAPLIERGRLLAEYEVEHATGAERDLGVARMHAALADERRLLVAEERGDRRRTGQRGRGADNAARID